MALPSTFNILQVPRSIITATPVGRDGRKIKGFITVEYVVLFNEADGQDTF